jgi:hypothetical protein
MPYNPAIPLATDLISDSQSDLYGNFQAIDIGTTGGAGNVGFSREHVTMTDAASGGLHVQATMKDQAAVTPSAGYGSYYASKTGTEAGTITEAVYKSGDSAAISLLSAIKAWGVFTGAVIADGFNFDSVTSNSGKYVVTFTNPLPNATYAVLVTAQMQTNFTSGSIIGIDARTVNGFQINDRALTGAFGAASDPVSFVVLQS